MSETSVFTSHTKTGKGKHRNQPHSTLKLILVFTSHLIRQMGFPRSFCFLVFFFFLVRGFPGGAVVKNPPANAGDTRRRFCPWVRKILWRRAWQPTAVFWPGESHGQRSLVGCCPRGHRESDATERTADTAHLHISLWPAALWTA